MSAILIVLVLLFIGIALALTTRKRIIRTEYLPEPRPLVPGSLFDPPSPQMIAEMDAEKLREELLARARNGDVSVLDETKANQALYHEVLSALLTHGSDVLELAAYVSRHIELRTSAQLAQAFIKHWDAAPNRNELATMLHVAARSDNADIYWCAVDVAKQAWDEGRLAQVSPKELAAAIEAEYWLLEPEARSSGTGYVLRRFIANVRRELKGATKQ
ncbi:MAG TPA: hypothetical protein VFZ34_33045 [Blastocatellia bacterium]|nr:hypothetical protein [Blastocatellia bacterium]